MGGSHSVAAPALRSGAAAAAATPTDRLKSNIRLAAIPVSELVMGRELGAGGFGTVREAMWKDQAVAVKEVTNVVKQAHMIDDFIREVRVHSLVNHPRIVRM